MKRNRIKKSKGFTLIELLIVIGILAVLAVTLLLALNPAEAQKRTRDTKRLRDAATLQAILNQYLESGNTFGTSCLLGIPGAQCTSNGSGPAGNAPQRCNDTGNGLINWLRINVCPYAQTVPVDPNNSLTEQRSFLLGAGGTGLGFPFYTARVDGSNYEINIRLEAESNRTLFNNDGGNNVNWYEVYSGPNNVLP